MAATGEGTLAGVRVVELGSTIATGVATMVMADAGADVLLVEPPGGVDLRSEPGFRTWGRNKDSTVVDVTDEADRSRFLRLLTHADVLIHSLPPEQAAALGLDDGSLGRSHPHLIVSSVLGWPVNHPSSSMPVDDHLVLARLGVLDEQLGRREGPIFVRFPLGSWCASWLAVIGVMARIVSRDRGGVTGPAHTSLAQGALIPMMMHWSRAETPGDMLRIGMPKNMMRASLFECSDGQWVHVMPPAPDDTPLMQEVWAEMGPEWVAEANARHSTNGMPGWLNWGAVVEAFKKRTSRQWLDNLWSSDIPAQRSAALGEIFHDEQTRANDYVIDVDDPVKGRISVGGFPLTLDPPCAVRTSVPEVGEDRGTVDHWLGGAPRSADPSTAHRFKYPLEGLKVVDFGNFLAGPLGPMLLADLGATVIKVEQATGDPMRWAEWPFAGCQRGKFDVALDIKSPEARPSVEALLKWADVVHHNLRLPAARRLGLDASSVTAVNPDAVFCHVSSYGPQGPRADWPGYDQLFQASCGWEYEGAGEGNPPMWHRFGFMDHLCAMSSAAATLMALHHKHVTGKVTQVAASLLGTGALTNSETYIDADGALVPVNRLDADQMKVSDGRRIFEVSDGWLATSAPDRLVERLCRVLGVTDPDLVPEAARSRSIAELTSELRAAGVPCEPVQRDQRYPFFDDAQNRAAGLVARYRHGTWGELEQPGSMWWLGEQSTRLAMAPPVLGEHTRHTLIEVGVDRLLVDSLIASGVAVDAAGSA